MKPEPRFMLAALLACVVAAGCASRAVKPQESYDKLKPIAAGPPASSAPNLVVHINNAGNGGQDRKSAVALFLNDQKVLPSNAQEPHARDHVYELSLAAGVYKIEAVYYASSFWKDKKFRITTHDGKVRIYSDYCTRLTVTLDRKPDGTLKQKKNFFSEVPEPLRRAMLAAPAPPRSDEPAATPVGIAGRAAPVAPPFSSSGQSMPPASTIDAAAAGMPTARPAPAADGRGGQIALQINTSPSNADVIVDDKYLGQSPLVAYVDRGQSHVLQISKDGYAEIIKWIDPRQFAGQKVYTIIEKLQRRQ